MPYIPTAWENETPASSPLKFTLKDADGNIIHDDVVIELKTSVTPGTPLNSTNMNKIESGIETAQETAEAEITLERLAAGILSADSDGRAKMADGFITLAKLSSDLRFQKIAEFTGDGVSNLDWTGIPDTFTHLVLIYNGLSSRLTAGWDGYNLRVNGNSAAVYYTNYGLWDASGFRYNSGVTNPHSDGLFAAILPAQNDGYLPSGSGVAIFPNYAGEAFYKTCMMISAFRGTYANGVALCNSQIQSADPISHLTGYMGSYYPRAGSVFSLYGFS